MTRNLPPLNWIRAFEAAARHEGFLRAAEELGVSAGAVSQMVKSLESHLGVTLFERRARGVRLTEAGRSYGNEIAPALDRIDAATARIADNPAPSRLRIAALPALAEKWLTPRLSGFHDDHPETVVELSVAKDIRDASTSAFDLAVHYDAAPPAGYETIPLFRDEMFPVCAPEFAATHAIERPDDLLGCRLLYDIEWADDWTVWFEAAGLPPTAGNREMGFALYSMAVEAAAAGQGVVMGHRLLISRELETGRLISPLDETVASPKDFALHVPLDRRARRAVDPFVTWLRAHIPVGAPV